MISGQREVLHFDHKPTKKEVDAEKAKLLTHKPVSADRRSFYECAVNYITINENTLKPSTRRSYEIFTRMLSEDFLKMPISDITQEDVQVEINKYSANHEPKGVRNAHGFISRILTFYRPDIVLRTNLPAKIPYEKYVPTPEEVGAVLDYCNGDKYWGAYSLLTYGIRRGELLALTLDDLTEDNMIIINKAVAMDKDNNYIVLDSPKTTSSFRAIRIDDELADFFRKQGCIYDGTVNNLGKHLYRIQKKLGQPHWRLHDFRAYMATELHQAGVYEADINAVGGWASSYTMKNNYRKDRISRDEEMQKRVAEILSRR